MKKSLASILLFIMIFTSIPVYALNDFPATGVNDYPNATGADGTTLNPYVINEAADFAWIVDNFEEVRNKNFIQTCDINLADYFTINGTDSKPKWQPIGGFGEGKMTSFIGTFDGQGYELTNLYFNSSFDSDTTRLSDSGMGGLFNLVGYDNMRAEGETAASTTIKNVNLSGTIIADATNTGGYAIGGIAAYADGSVIDGCSFQGSITVKCNSTIGGADIGGIVGYNTSKDNPFKILNCSNEASITVDGDNANVGGMLGVSHCESPLIISDCYNSGEISFINRPHTVYEYAPYTGQDKEYYQGNSGGIVGLFVTNNSNMARCYNKGILTPSVNNSITFPKNVTQECLYRVGSVVGKESGSNTYNNSFYIEGGVIEAIGDSITTSNLPQSKSDSFFKTSNNFTGWNSWVLQDGSYPVLKKVPKVSTTSSNDVTASTATISANVSSNGDGTLTERGISYRVNTSEFVNQAADTIDIGTYSVNLSGLLDDTTYFARAYATNEMGTTYGEPISFTTSKVGSDTTAPTLSSASASGTSHNATTLNFTSDEAGTYYYLVYAATETAPNAATVEAQGTAVAKGTSAATTSANTASVTGLAASTEYKAYVIVKDAADNVSNVSTIAFTTTAAPDTTAPTLSSASASGTSHNATMLNFTSDEAGTYYYLVYAAADTAPSAATIEAQGAAVAKGTNTASASANTASVTGLAASTAYKSYVIVKDSANNVSDVSAIAFTTTAEPDTTKPILSSASASGTSHNATTLNFTSDEAGTYYYLVYAATETAPNASVVEAQGTAVAKGTSAATTSANTVSVTGLAASTEYKAYVIVKDAADNVSNVSTIAFTTTAAPDTTAPTLSSASASGTSHNATTLNFTSDEAGTYYYLVYSASDTAPIAATVEAQGTAVAKGTSAATTSANTASVTGLAASTEYKAYVIVKDAADNVSNVSTIAFTTTAAPDTTAPTLSSASASGTSHNATTLNFTSDEAGTYYYLVYAATETAPNASVVEAQGIAVAKGTSAATTSANTASVTGLTASTEYKAYVIVKDSANNVSDVSTISFTTTAAPDITKPVLTAGAVSRTSDTAATVKFTSNEPGSYYYAVVADGAGEPTIDTSGAGTVCTTLETIITNPTGLTAGAKDIYIKVKDAAENISNALKIDIAAYVSTGGGSSGGGGNSSTTTTPSSQDKVIVIVNGKEHNAGTETKTTENGKSTVTVKVDNKAIQTKIDEAVKNNPTGTNNVVQVPVADTKSEITRVELTGDIVKRLEQKTFDVSVKRADVEYVIPAEEFTISKVAQNLGLQEKDLKDIKVEVEITKLDEKVVAKYNEVAKANGAKLVFPPVSFEVVAKTTKVDGKTGTVEIGKFNNYVERVMEIPTGVDPSKITTGIVFNPDGTYSHVPTEVFKKEGKWYAKLNSLTNSNYSVVWNPVTVKSVENHWAKNAVNDMASRLVIFNPESFDPSKAITRADFAEYIVRALGVYREGSSYENKFKDVGAKGERTLAILIANEYGIVTGYSDGTFKPDALITREEAMAMYQRAMKITKLTGSDTNRYQSYTDFSKVSAWASASVKDVLAAHVFNGTSARAISPKSNLTYAEAAQAIKNLLVESKLINK